MLPCKTVEWLYEALPIDAWRAWLVRRHMEKCPACGKKLLGLEEARALLAGPVSPDEWTGLRHRLIGIRDAQPTGRRSRVGSSMGWFRIWAPRAIMLLALLIAGFWLVRESGREVSLADAAHVLERFELDYVRVGGQPAEAIVYQPQGTDMIIVWAEKPL
jgi:hypothetical protein